MAQEKFVSAEMTAQAFYNYATEHYNENGWDFLVECWSVDEIAEELGGTRTLRGAIAKIGPTLRMQDENRRAVKNEAF